MLATTGMLQYHVFDCMCLLITPHPLDDDGDSPGAKEFPDPGTIEVHFAHIIECRKVSRRFPLDCDASRAVHERSKKLGAHCVS